MEKQLKTEIIENFYPGDETLIGKAPELLTRWNDKKADFAIHRKRVRIEPTGKEPSEIVESISIGENHIFVKLNRRNLFSKLIEKFRVDYKTECENKQRSKIRIRNLETELRSEKSSELSRLRTFGVIQLIEKLLTRIKEEDCDIEEIRVSCADESWMRLQEPTNVKTVGVKVGPVVYSKSRLKDKVKIEETQQFLSVWDHFVRHQRTISDAKSPESVTNLENFENLKIEETDTKEIILDKRKTEYFSRREKLDEYLKEKVYPLVSAKMMLQLMATRLDTPCKLNVEDDSPNFVMYNYVRIVNLLAAFEGQDDEEIDLSLLKDEDEWKFAFEHLLNFDQTVNNLIENLKKGTGGFSCHNLVGILNSFCKDFGSYYGRVHVLKDHRRKLMVARIELLKALANMMRFAFYLFDIKPVLNM